MKPIDVVSARTRYAEVSKRLREPAVWFPAPALLSFVLVLLFTGHLLIGLNPRLGSTTDVVTFSAEEQPEGSIWLSVSVQNNDVVVTTFNRKVFTWPKDTNSLTPLSNLKSYLIATVDELATQASIAKYLSIHQAKVILAVDESLRYYHVRPIIHLLAEVGLDDYGFETRIIEPLSVAEQSLGEVQNNESKL